MTAILTDELKEQFGNCFVTVSDAVQDDAERERLHAVGTKLFMQHMSGLQRLYDNGQTIPRLVVGEIKDTNTLGPVRYEDGIPVINISANEANKADLLGHYLEQYRTEYRTEQETVHAGWHEGNTKDGQHSVHAGNRGRYDLLEGGEARHHHKNTSGDYRHYRHMLKTDPKQWKFWLDSLFAESSMEGLRPGDWLRSLRLHAGREAGDMARIAGLADSSNYSKYENGKVGGGKLPISMSLQFLKKNAFRWPVDEDGNVQPQYAKKFMAKMGHGHVNGITGELDRQWLEKQPEEKQAAIYLSHYRNLAHSNRNTFLEGLSFGMAALRGWETGATRVRSKYIPEIAQRIREAGAPFDEDYFRERVELSNRVIGKKRFESRAPDNHTRFHVESRKSANAVNSAAVFLGNAMFQRGLNNKDLAVELGVDPTLISQWKRGKVIIPNHRVETLVVALNQHGDGVNLDEFRALVDESRAAKRPAAKTGSTHVGDLTGRSPLRIIGRLDNIARRHENSNRER